MNKRSRISKQNLSGFSLAEIAIVLVIGGFLLAGAISKGGSLIKSAKTNNMISEIKGIETSISSFKNTYGGLPGNLSQYDSTGLLSATDCVSGSGNNYGAGNERISAAEGYLGWCHLLKSELYTQAKSTGGPASVATPATLKVDVPKTALGGGYFLGYNVIGTPNANQIIVGMPVDMSSSAIPGALLTPLEAKKITEQLDDGRPNTGKVRAMNGSDVTSSAENDCLNATGDGFNISNKQPACVLGISID